VVSEQLVVLLQTVRVKPLERASGRLVQRRARAAQQAVVGDFLDQRVLERVYKCLRFSMLVEQLELGQRGELLLQIGLARCNRLQEAHGKFSAQDGCHLQHAFGRFRQPIYARGQDTLDGVRQNLNGTSCLCLQRQREFLEEQRVALRLLQDRLSRRFHALGAPDHGRHDLLACLSRKHG
jgi:hypothetical protein